MAEDDTSTLTDQEAAEYAACQRALAHYNQASWMYGKALQAIRDGRYYRGEFRTWVEFLETRCGISESQAHRIIEEWPLAAAITSALGAPPVQSHVTKLMPIVKAYEVGAGVLLYDLLRKQFWKLGARLTADHVQAATRAVLERAGRRAELEHVQAAAAEITTGSLALPQQTRKDTGNKQSKEQDVTPLDTLAVALKAQRQAWSLLTKDTVAAALQADTKKALSLLDEIESVARRTGKRSTHRPQ